MKNFCGFDLSQGNKSKIIDSQSNIEAIGY